MNNLKLIRGQGYTLEWNGTEDEKFYYDTVEFLIDDTNLIYIIKNYEAKFKNILDDYDISGLYTGVDPSNPYEYIQQLTLFNDRRPTNLYQCDVCRSLYCPFDLVFKIKTEENFVIWHDFHQRINNITQPINYDRPHIWKSQRPKHTHNEIMMQKVNWDYTNFGPFIFDKKQYIDSINKFIKTINYV